MAVITVSRQIGSGGDEIAHQLCKVLEYQFFEKRLMNKVAVEMGWLEQEVIDFSEDSYETKGILERLFPPGGPMMAWQPGGTWQGAFAETSFITAPNVEAETTGVGTWAEDTTGAWKKVVERIGETDSVDIVKNLILAASKQTNMVIVGRGGQVVLQEAPEALHVRIIAPLETRIRQIQQAANLGHSDAKKFVEHRDRAAAEYLHRFYDADISDPDLYHLIVNTGKWETSKAVNLIVHAMEAFCQSEPEGTQRTQKNS